MEDAHQVQLSLPVVSGEPGYGLRIDGRPVRNVVKASVESDVEGATLVTLSFYANVNTDE